MSKLNKLLIKKLIKIIIIYLWNNLLIFRAGDWVIK